MPEVQPPSLGRVVHYVLPDSSPRRGEHRSARITSVHGGDLVNLAVDFDQVNDLHPEVGDVNAQNFQGRAWSVSRDDTAGTYGTWHFPEFVPAVSKTTAPPAYTPPPVQQVEQFTTLESGDGISTAETTSPVPALTAEQIAAVEVTQSPVLEDAPAADAPTGLPLPNYVNPTLPSNVAAAPIAIA
jgi:hypothetical protein